MSVTKTIPFTGGVARVLSRAELENYEAWTGAFQGKSKDHRFYEIVADTLDFPTGVNGDLLGLAIPKAFFLEQNYPNPFNPSTKIQYHISAATDVTLKVYNEIGQEVTTLVNQRQAPGTYSASWDARNYASGVYYYRLEVAGSGPLVKKALLVK